jgi:hypothetical protein
MHSDDADDNAEEAQIVDEEPQANDTPQIETPNNE